MLDILLVNPGDIAPYPAMGLAELVAYVREHGYSVGIIDFSAHGSLSDVLAIKAKTVGISVPCGLVSEAFKLANNIKKETEAIVIFGGYYPTFCYNECLQNKSVDFAVIGEGEIPLLQLLDYLLKGERDLLYIPGLAYRTNEKIVSNPRTYVSDLDSLPIPAFDLLPLQDYPKKSDKKSIFTLSTGRGCPFGCAFCSQSAFWERKVRFRSPQKVLQIIDAIMTEYPVDYVRILDDIFPLRPKEALEIARGLKERNLAWECQARIDSVSESLLKDFAKNKLDRIFFGVESGSPKIQRFMGKKLNPTVIKQIISVAHAEGIKIKVSFQIGTPGETKQDIDLSIQLANELNTDSIALFTSTPFPGTLLHKIATEQNLIKHLNPDDCDPSVVNMGTGYLSAEEVEQEAQRFLREVKCAEWGHHSKKGRKLRELKQFS